MSKCKLCEEGWPVKRVPFYDGSGSRRMHVIGPDPEIDGDDILKFCARKSSARHWVVTAFFAICFALLGGAVIFR